MDRQRGSSTPGRWRLAGRVGVLLVAALVLTGVRVAAVEALLPTAHAQDPVDATWYVGLPLAGVSLLAPEGGLPDADLEPLLRAHQGESADPSEVRADLVTLFRVGEFAAVEVEVQPWFVQAEDGSLAPAVMLTYVVYPAPKVAQVRAQRTDSPWFKRRRKEVLDAASVDVGSVFYPDLDGPLVEQRVAAHLRDRGYPEAQVEVDTQGLGGEEVEVWIRVSDGPPRTLGSVAFVARDLPPEVRRRLEPWSRRAGVVEGDPVSAGALDGARYEIRRRLARMPPWYVPSGARWPGGWVEARVPPPAVIRDSDGRLHATYTVEPGPKLVLEVDGVGWRGGYKAREALGIDERLRLTRGFVEEAPDRIESYLQEDGYLEAHVEVDLVAEEALKTLRIDADRGPSHHLRRFNDRYRFHGATSLPHAQLRTVMDQSSDEVLKRGRVTEPEVIAALRSVEEVYRAHGYQDASLALSSIETEPFLWVFPFTRLPLGATGPDRLLGVRLPRAVRVEVEVDEGPLSRLSSLQVRGAAPLVELDFALDAAREMEGQPFSPQAVELLSRRVLEAHERSGHLLADVRVIHQRESDGDIESIIAVQPGPQVLLRSVTLRGARRTRPRILYDEIDEVLTLGQPLRSSDLAAVRRSLYETGALSSVSAELVGEEETGDLVIAIEERARWGFEAGLGVASDQGLRGFGRASRRNVLGLAHRIDAYGLLGLRWRSDSLTDWMPDFAQPEWRSALTYTAPRFPVRSQRLVVDVLLRELAQERTWRMARSGVGLAIESRLASTTTLRAAFRVEGRRLDEVDPGALIDGEPWAAVIDRDQPELPSPWRLQDAVSLLLLHDLRDNPLQPTRGVVLSVLGDWTPGAVGGEETTLPFVKGEARIGAYLPVGGLVLHVAGEGARGWALGDGVIPLEDRYRLGGTGSMRGFRRDAVGPRNEVSAIDIDWPDELSPVIGQTNLDAPTRWVSTGGDTRASATVELLMPLPALGLRSWEGYAAALFADVGNVWLLGPDATATSELPRYTELFDPLVRYGVGTGIRVATPIGPLQVDVACNLDSALATGERRQLLRDDWHEPPFRAHLSLGTLW